MNDEARWERRHWFHGPRWLRIAGLTVIGVVGVAVFALVFGYLVQVLWNWLMPAIFNLGAITYWQAFGIVLLAKLIFGGAGGGLAGRGGPSHKHGRPPWEGDAAVREWHGNWKDFWGEEGREAFRRYVERKRKGDTEGTGDAAKPASPEG